MRGMKEEEARVELSICGRSKCHLPEWSCSAQAHIRAREGEDSELAHLQNSPLPKVLVKWGPESGLDLPGRVNPATGHIYEPKHLYSHQGMMLDDVK